MNLGGTYNRGGTTAPQNQTNNQLLMEQNKNLRKLNDAICCLGSKKDQELSTTTTTKFHIGSTNYYAREVVTFDSTTGLEVSRVTEYSSDGVTFTTTPPVGTPIIGWITPSKLDPEIVCLTNDGGATVVKGVVEFDVNVIPATKTIYLFDGSLATGYTVVPCQSKTFDTEFRDVCVDGETWTQILVFDKSVSLTTPIQTGWLNALGVITPTPDVALINNLNCLGCVSAPQGILLSWGV